MAKNSDLLPTMPHARPFSTLSDKICFSGDLSIKSISTRSLELENAEQDMYQGWDFWRCSDQERVDGS
jgi:hypothetical protein